MLLEQSAPARSAKFPGVVTTQGSAPTPMMLDDLDRFLPARDLGRRRNKYFIGMLDPCASIEFTRGCPWDCSFCSAWTFYGRSYRKSTPKPRVKTWPQSMSPTSSSSTTSRSFIHNMALRSAHEWKNAESRSSTISRPEPTCCAARGCLSLLAELGPGYMFLGVEAIDEEGLKPIASAIAGRQLQGARSRTQDRA